MKKNVNCLGRPRGVTLWLTCLWFLAWSISSKEAADLNCCSNGTEWGGGKNCSDGSEIRLDCPYGFYKIDPKIEENDKFIVDTTDNVTWLVQYEGTAQIRYDRFCLVNNRNDENRIALICFEQMHLGESRIWSSALYSVLSIVSAIFLIATLAVYVALPELREVQDKAMMAAVTSLAVSYIILSVQHTKEFSDDEDLMCVTLAFLLYYAFMSAFFWLNIVAFNIWRSVWFKSCIVKDKALFAIYSAIGWFVPACFLMVTIAAHHINGSHLKPRFGENACWFGGTTETWAFFYGPIAVLLTLNIVYLGLTGWRLWHEYREYNGNKLRVLRFKCLLCVKLMLVMGVTWIFEVVSFASGTENWYWIPTDILNALQGLVIFLLLVVTRKRVRKLLAKKRPCGLVFPKSWMAYEDEECEAALPEELELSQQG